MGVIGLVLQRVDCLLYRAEHESAERFLGFQCDMSTVRGSDSFHGLVLRCRS